MVNIEGLLVPYGDMSTSYCLAKWKILKIGNPGMWKIEVSSMFESCEQVIRIKIETWNVLEPKESKHRTRIRNLGFLNLCICCFDSRFSWSPFSEWYWWGEPYQRCCRGHRQGIHKSAGYEKYLTPTCRMQGPRVLGRWRGGLWVSCAFCVYTLCVKFLILCYVDYSKYVYHNNVPECLKAQILMVKHQLC